MSFQNPLPERLQHGLSLTIITVHAEGEVGDVIISGVSDPPECKTMFDKMQHFWKHNDHIRKLVLQEPRGRASMCTNILMPPCDPRADAGFLIMESDEWVPMSGSNTICTTTVLLETGIVKMTEPVTTVKLDTAAGLVTVTAECENGKCKNVAFDNVASFVWELDCPIEVPDLGTVKVDVAWGGMIYILVNIDVAGIDITSANGAKLVAIGERIKRAAQKQIEPIHPENPEIRGVSNFVWMAPQEIVGENVRAVNAVVVSPGRLDRSPCGTGTCARMAVMHERGQLAENQTLLHISPIGTEFQAHIRGITKVGKYNAILPTVKGRAWISGSKQIVVDPQDPFPEGFRVGDAWHVG